jgi:hypothetical protein
MAQDRAAQARAFVRAAVLSSLAVTATSVTWTSAAALDLQPLVSQASVGSTSFLGGDVCASIPLDDEGLSYLYLFGDTIVGRFLPNGTRQIKAMPRNNVGILYTDPATRRPLSTLSHSWRIDPSNAVHVGFFSPPASEDPSEEQYYWPAVGARVRNQSYVVAMRMKNSGSGLFPFAVAGYDVIAIPRDSDTRFDDPLNWPASEMPIATFGPFVNDNFTVGNAVTYVADEDQVYLLGSYKGARSPQWSAAFMARVSGADWEAGRFGTGLQFFLQNQTWSSGWYSGVDNDIALLFDFNVPSETTMSWVPALNQYVILIANTFLYDSVMMRAAPSLTGPWAKEVALYKIPDSMRVNKAFCYAAKRHSEFEALDGSDIVFTYNCNVDGFDPLLTEPQIYTPQFVRTTFTQ